MKKLKLFNIIDFKSFVFVGFLSAGDLKEDPRLQWLPIDLTVALAGLSWLIAAFMVIRPGFRFPKSLYWAIILFFLFGVPVVWTKWTPYATVKVSRLFTLTLSAALLPVLMFRTEKDLRKIFNSFTLISVIMTCDAISNLGSEVDRVKYEGNKLVVVTSEDSLTATGATTISVGRMTGMGALWLVLLVESGERNAALFLLIGPLVLVMIGSGSRGPLLAFIVAMCIQSALSLLWIKYSHKRTLIIYSLLFALFLGGWALAPKAASDRIQIVLNGEQGTSGEARTDAYSLSLMQIGCHPLGVGWGGFADINQQHTAFGVTLRYPHNLFLELTLECGWICGLYIAIMSVISLYGSSHVYRIKQCVEYRALFALIIFNIINICFSGDINDSRYFICMMMLGVDSAVRLERIGRR